MKLWFLQDFARVELERSQIESLERESPWLRGVVWTLAGSDLCVEADIEVHGNIYPVQMRYPRFFPTSPPTVTPREASERWSEHQYGADGELCLEWGADNWHPEITGADMLRSA